MSVTFDAVDSTDPRVSPFGTYPRRVEVLGFEDGYNLANSNARALLRLLGIDGEDLCGELTLPEVRRALIGATARFDRLCGGLTRSEEVVYGEPREREDVVELRPVRAVFPEFSAADLRDRLDRFASFITAIVADGVADGIRWG